MVKVYFDFHASLNGLNKGYVSVQDDDTRSINCQTDPRSVASAIQSRLLPTAEQTYFKLKAKCEKCELMRSIDVKYLPTWPQRLARSSWRR